jgi:hypothetical protein
MKTHISTNKTLGVVAHACLPSDVGSINRRIMVQTTLGIKVRPFLKNY